MARLRPLSKGLCHAKKPRRRAVGAPTSGPIQEWRTKDIEKELGWDRFCPHPGNNQLAACVSGKLEKANRHVNVSKREAYYVRLSRP